MTALALVLSVAAVILAVVALVESRANLREADRVLKLARDVRTEARAAANVNARWAD